MIKLIPSYLPEVDNRVFFIVHVVKASQVPSFFAALFFIEEGSAPQAAGLEICIANFSRYNKGQ